MPGKYIKSRPDKKYRDEPYRYRKEYKTPDDAGPEGKSKAKPKPKPKAKSELASKKQPGKGEQYAKQRKKAASLRTAAKKVTYKGGLSVGAIKNDKSLSATEKTKIIAAINKKKGASDG